MRDVVFKAATVVDGSGTASYRADVAVDGDRIVEVGTITESARRVVDADGLVLCPGFVDIHTHYDAQFLWDSSASPSLLHGTTTVIGGNCGFSLAPQRPGDPYLKRMMSRVEGIPLTALESGPPWSWSSFRDYLGQIDGRLDVNAGFLIGHSAIRRTVLGDAATQPAVTEDQLAEMEAILEQALADGALGFSTSRSRTHIDGDGEPVPSRAASRTELMRLAAVVGRFDGTSLQTIPDDIIAMSEAEAELMVAMSRTARRPINWNLLKVSARDPGLHERQLAVSDRGAADGARIVALTLPQVNALFVTLSSGFLFDAIPGWAEVVRTPLEERMRLLADPSIRSGLRANAEAVAGSTGAGVIGSLAEWHGLRIAESPSPENAEIVGLTVGDVAAARGTDPFDTLLAIALGDRLETGFTVPPMDDDAESWRLRAAIWSDPRTVVGGSDAGAHVDLMCGASYTTTMLGEVVRERQLVTLETAVHLMSDAPARLYGLVGRGRIATGSRADLVLFDPAEVGADRIETHRDLPGRAPRLMRGSTGVHLVMVNGIPVVEDGRAAARGAGRLLRSGRDSSGTALR